MLRFLADENFNGKVIAALQRRISDLDIVRVQDTELYGAEDPEVLSAAADGGRVLLTHDLATMVGFAWERVKAGQAMPGVLAVPLGRPAEELEARILFFPLR